MDRKQHRIHKKLKKHFPNSVKKARKLVSFKYPKLFIFIISIIFAYYLFSHPAISGAMSSLGKLSYIGFFIAGILLSFGFSTPFGLGLLFTLNPQNIFLSVIISSVGSMFVDVAILKLIRFSFMNEIEELGKTKVLKKIKSLIYSHKNLLIKHYLLYVFAGILIATPLPDEIGVAMLAGLTSIMASRLAIMSFILHAIMIYLILLI